MFFSTSISNSPSSPIRRTSLPADCSLSPSTPKSSPAAWKIWATIRETRIAEGWNDGVVAQEPEILDLFLAGILELELQRLGPVGPFAGRLAEGVAVPLEVHQGVLETLVHLALVHQCRRRSTIRRGCWTNTGQISSHARQAQQAQSSSGWMTRAVEAGRLAVGLGRRTQELRIHRLDQVARRERKAAVVCRTNFLALAAPGAGVHLEQLTPGEVARPCGPPTPSRPEAGPAGPRPARVCSPAKQSSGTPWSTGCTRSARRPASRAATRWSWCRRRIDSTAAGQDLRPIHSPPGPRLRRGRPARPDAMRLSCSVLTLAGRRGADRGAPFHPARGLSPRRPSAAATWASMWNPSAIRSPSTTNPVTAISMST